MKQKKTIKPTESELEILQVLWENGPSSVREVNDHLSRKREVGYTTTLKLLQIMTEKKLVVRIEKERKHIYSAEASREETQILLLDRFLESTFSGAAMKMVMQVLGNHKASKEELDEIKKMIKKLEGGRKDGPVK